MYIFNGVTFKIVKKNNELVIESDHNLDEFEKDVFIKFFNEGTLNIKGKEYRVINGETVMNENICEHYTNENCRGADLKCDGKYEDNENICICCIKGLCRQSKMSCKGEYAKEGSICGMSPNLD